MGFKVPIDFVFDADSAEEAKLLCNEFLLRAVSEYRKDYRVVDYDIPYGYPIEPEVSGT